MNLIRTQSPQTKTIKTITLPKIEKFKLDNGIPIFSINTGTQDVVKVQFVFQAGSWFQNQSLEAYFTGQMLDEGSRNYSASQIAEKLDDYGAFVNKLPNRDHSTIDVYTLNKHLKTVMEVVADFIKHPRFGKEELNRLREQERHEFIVRQQKVDHIAQKHFSKLIFSDKHPYGRSAELEDYDKITDELLRKFHYQHYSGAHCQIFISGKIKEESHAILNYYFGRDSWGSQEPVKNRVAKTETTSGKKHFIPKENVLQSAIRLGQKSIKRSHPDYFGLSVVTTLLGGYFGSRLMSNIREDKGYTYGIHAAIYPYLHESAFVISSEVGAHVATKALDEIRFEMKRLRTEKVTEEELNLVKNYISGSFLRSLNGPFALGQIVKSLYEQGLPEDFYQKYLNKIHQLSVEEVLSISNQYLNDDQMIELIVGQRD
jgi:predicted Zn-dependent peptidase